MEPQTMAAELAQWTAERLVELGFSAEFRLEPLLVEASHRHFYRVHGQRSTPSTFVVMASPPDKENNNQFVSLARVFANHGVGVPEIIASHTQAGYFLLSDLGELHFADAYESDQREAALAAGIHTLIDIQTINDPAVPPYDAARFRDELNIFRQWFVEGWLAEAFPSDDLDDVFEELIANTQTQVQCCVHRDFHCRNLLFGADNDDRPVGVVDFQDALMGPVSYDLASLLRDCYFRFTEPEIAHWRNYYLQRTPFQLDPDEFAVHLDLTAVQRQLKAVGIFARLQLRDDKTSHLPHIPPVLCQLDELAGAYPRLAPLRSHLSRWRRQADSRLGANS
jgi:aminoglycoside/choline kinase family phosphotransferase